ncbi:MAG: hypothetical protein U0Z44_05920 [Kouleothrix sp.]
MIWRVLHGRRGEARYGFVRRAGVGSSRAGIGGRRGPKIGYSAAESRRPAYWPSRSIRWRARSATGSELRHAVRLGRTRAELGGAEQVDRRQAGRLIAGRVFAQGLAQIVVCGGDGGFVLIEIFERRAGGGGQAGSEARQIGRELCEQR